MLTYFISYLVLNVALALIITALFSASGAVLLKAIVRCSTDVPLATVRILTLVYGTLALGRVFLSLNPETNVQGFAESLILLSDTTGANLTFFAVLAGMGIVTLMIIARPLINMLVEVDQKQERIA
ncbi:hypothetical protein [Kordiimonas sp. SCSIO 12610]|uniref:hypothetical protein n=1 Tax=Kordiimonas sp. SCSIO 12610 TaxID=2829597 RepID=UPI00210DBF0B|nr:hypothetical protein [Kordiimonas sp. SCSIO 12610]UTW56697.1 hypothetical protein KFF44_07360 [Kordiimonas sp. SCSIO 12610]